MIEKVVCVIFACIMFYGVIYLIIDEIKRDMMYEEFNRRVYQQCIQQIYRNSIPRFSIEEHYEKLEKVTEEIVKSRKQNDYTIVLWLLEDGLKINKDGTTEWIKRWIEEETKDLTKFEICSDTELDYGIQQQIQKIEELRKRMRMCAVEQNIARPYYIQNDYIISALKGIDL